MSSLADYNFILLFYHLPEGIVVPPQPKNISLNQVAVLNCTAIATFIYWEVNGEPADDWRSRGIDDRAPTVILDDAKSLRLATLRVEGSYGMNSANLTCIAILSIVGTDPSIATSDKVFIQVQG